MKFFFPHHETIVSLQVKDGSFRAVLLNRDTGNLSLIAYEACSIQNGFDEALEMLRRLLKKAGPGLKAVLLIVDREEVLIRSFRITAGGGPEKVAREVQEMISQYIPYDISEIVSDYHLIQPENSGEPAVSVVIGHRRVVDEKLAELKAISLIPDRIGYSSEAIFLACRRQNKEWIEAAGALLIDVDTESSELIFASRDKMVSSKKVDLKSRDYETGDPSVFSRLFREIEILLREDYPVAVERRITRIVISGRPSPSGFLKKAIQENLQIEPEIFGIQNSEFASFSLTPHWGAFEALRPEALNLLPEEVKKDKGQEEKINRKNQILYSLACFSAALLLLFVSHLGARQFLLLSAEKKIEKLRSRTLGIEETALGLRLRTKHEKNKWIFLEVLAALHKITPPDMVMTEIEYNRENGFILQGTAPTNQQVTEFFNQLRGLPDTHKWTLDYSQKKKIGDEEIFYFQIQLGLRQTPV